MFHIYSCGVVINKLTGMEFHSDYSDCVNGVL